MQAWKHLKKEKYPDGVKLTTKVLRDYFATQVSAQVSDPNTVKNLMRHTNLNTTSRYTRTVPERMKEAVKNLGATSGGRSGATRRVKNTQKIILLELALEGLRARQDRQINGGRSRNRTYDLAHVRRAL